MKPHHLLSSLLLLLTTALTQAEDFTYDGITYTVLTDSTCEVSACSIEEDGQQTITIPEIAYNGETPYTVTAIGNRAFYGCKHLHSVDIPSTINAIKRQAFATSSLYTIIIPGSITTIESAAFENCGSLHTVVLPSSLTTIPDNLFYNCGGLKSVNIPSTVTTIGQMAFDACAKLTSIDIPNSVSQIGGYAFYGCSGITYLTIPNSVTSIGGYAFYGCSGIKYLCFSDDESELSLEYSFGMVTPTSVYFGRQMDFTKVPRTTLESVEFGENVTSIADGTFIDASALRTVISRNPVPPTTDDTFSNSTYLDGVLYVPEGSIAAYEEAPGWKNFWEIHSLDSYSGIDEAVAAEKAQVSVEGGAICVSGAAEVRIVAMNGVTVYSGRGDCRTDVAPGIYVVIADNVTTKFAVK